jgi:hypothetical protein
MVIVLIGALVAVTVTFSRSLRSVADHADRVHDRSVNQLSSVLDRLMAKNFEDFKVYDTASTVHGSVEYPEESDRPWNVPGVFVPRRGVMGGAVEVGQEEGEE